MKLHLPIALAALVAAHAQAADSKVIRPLDIIEVGENITADSGIYDRLQVSNTTTYTAVVKEGNGILTIEDAGNLNMSTGFVAREGKTVITGDTTITSSTSVYPMLMVGGLNASLEIDGATFTTNSIDGNRKSWNSAVVIGGRDGDGSLKLTGGAVLRNNHGLFAGGQSRSADFTNSWTFEHICGSYLSKDTSVNTLYRDSQTTVTEDGKTIYNNFQDTHEPWGTTFKRLQSTADITVEGGSKLYIGTCQSLSNVTIHLTDAGTEMSDGNQIVGDTDGLQSATGDTVYGGTKITVENGATWTARNDLYMSTYGGTDDDGFNGDTLITVGDGGTMNSLRDTYFGQSSYGAKAELVVENGGIANIVNASAGFDDENKSNYDSSRTDNIATITVKEGGQYNGSALKLHLASTLTNDGTITLKDATQVRASSMGVTTSTQNVDSILTIDGGSLTNNGSISAENISISAGLLILGDGSSITGDVLATGGLIQVDGVVSINGTLTLGDVATGGQTEVATFALAAADASSLTLQFSEGAYINMNGNKVAISDLAFIDVVDTDGNFTLFTNVANAEALNGVEFTYTDAEGNSQVAEIAVSNGNVYVGKDTTIPEPTTATLSLLALAALAGRRRRK